MNFQTTAHAEYTNRVAVANTRTQFWTPDPSEFAASGTVAERIEVQRIQWTEGWNAFHAGGKVHDFEPAARRQGYIEAANGPYVR